MEKRKTTRIISEGAIMVAAALVLSYLEIPIGVMFGGFGGSINFVLVPLIIYAVRNGTGWGLVAGLVFGTLKFFFAGGVAVNWQSMLLDYSVAYMFVGFAGLCKNRKYGLITGTLVGCAGRFLIHFISGITIYAEYMPENFLNMTMTNTWFYSLLYNGSYMIPNTLLALLVAVLLTKPLKKYLINE